MLARQVCVCVRVLRSAVLPDKNFKTLLVYPAYVAVVAYLMRHPVPPALEAVQKEFLKYYDLISDVCKPFAF